MKIFLFLLFSFFFLFVFGQDVELKGVCKDKTGKPIEFVRIYCSEAIPLVNFSDASGNFFLNLNKDASTVEIIAKSEEITLTKKINTNLLDLSKTTIEFQFDFSQIKQVTISSEKVDYHSISTLSNIDYQTIPMGSLERSLVYTTAASSNNELTSNYNVRGGSFDENLIYVNGFSIYRPQLTRSGQQEGMSFINSALVDNVKFSAGGFDARYGDKLSSVLDVKYRKPDSLRVTGMVSLLGVETSVENKIGSRFDFMLGARYRNNGYLLSSLPTKGTYNPVFADVQLITNYAITEKLNWSILGHYSSNKFNFQPESAQTDFGVANEAYRFNIYFQGQEKTQFEVYTAASSLSWQPSKSLKLDLYTMFFASNEEEKFDILGQYFINELETDPSKDEYGDSISVLGVGSYLDHSRNQLNSNVFTVYHNGEKEFRKRYLDSSQNKILSNSLLWGVQFQQDVFTDNINEWKNIDSAGYTINSSNSDELDLFYSLKSQLSLKNTKYSSFIQMNSMLSNNRRNKIVSVNRKRKVNDTLKIIETFTDTISSSISRLVFDYGLRTGYTTINQELYFTPRFSLSYYPRVYMVQDGKVTRRNVKLRLASGLYYQPPFYREFRTFEGQLNTNVLAQKSFHIVGGTDIFFNMWKRDSPFKFSAELFYKRMWDLNVFEVQNVRTRYYADNDSRAFAYGLDLNIYGQFIKGIESFFKIGLLNTKEDLLNDSYINYYNSNGEIVTPYIEDQVVVDSATIYPGYIPRPTDQLLNFGALIQDRMPGYESYTVQLGFQFGTPLPFGPPDQEHYKDTLRNAQPYFRVDLGMSYDLLYKNKGKSNFLHDNFTDAKISLEVFNLLGINNVLSKQWIQDVNGTFYSIPNFLTQRRFNLKFILRF